MKSRAKLLLSFRMIYSLLLWGICFLLLMLGDIVIPIIHTFTGNKKEVAHGWACFGSKVLLLLAGVKVVVEGRENLPAGGPIIVMPNHQGHFDYPILFSVLPFRVIYLVRKEFFSIPVFRGFLRIAGFYLLDRRAAMSAYNTLTEVAEEIRAGESVLIFPEGTHSLDGSVGKFKDGGFRLALQEGASILPIAICGSHKIMPKFSWIITPQKVLVKIGKPINFEKKEKLSSDDYDSALYKVRGSILEMHQELEEKAS